MASKDLVTIEDEMTPADVVGYFKEPTHYDFRFERDPEQVNQEIRNRILGATSEEELFGEEQVLKAQEMIGKPFTLVAIEFRPSEYDTPPFYGLFHIVLPGGEMELMSCGAETVMLKAAKAAHLGLLPKGFRIVKADKPTAGGYYPLDLVRANGDF